MSKVIFGSSEQPDCGWSMVLEQPAAIYAAYSLEEVVPLLDTVETAAASGAWVALMLSYEAAPAFDHALKAHDPAAFPLAWAAIFNQSLPVPPNGRFMKEIEQVTWTPQVTREEYNDAIARVRDLIATGYTYQVNYTFPLLSSFNGNPEAWYHSLCGAQNALYPVYIDLGTFKVLSLSPELFFERRGNHVRARPMKGTIKRGRWTAEDEALAQSLAASSKDRAENVMIVDLIRNDLGKVAVPGQVRVSELYEVERYPTLWQMTSTVEATLRPDVSLMELLAALFPCGSVTGAPKISTMGIIRDLEPFPRGIYTGAIGLIRPGGDCTFNVAIRTLLLDSTTGEVTFGVGGGVTIDSTAEREYDECLLKSSFLSAPQPAFRLLESIMLEDGEFFLLDLHLERLQGSARYFGFMHPRMEVLETLERLRLEHSTGRWKVRLLLANDAELTIEVLPLQAEDSRALRVGLATGPVQSSDRFLFHKTTNRAVYEQALRARPDCDDVVLWNERGEVTESTIANVVLVQGQELWTPALHSGLLPGVFRAELLATRKIRERVIYLEELRQAESFFLINSVQKWRRAELVSGP